MKGQTLLVWGLVVLLVVAIMSTEARQTRTRLKCCTRKDLKLLRVLHKHKALKFHRFCKKCKKPATFPINPGIPLPYL